MKERGKRGGMDMRKVKGRGRIEGGGVGNDLLYLGMGNEEKEKLKNGNKGRGKKGNEGRGRNDWGGSSGEWMWGMTYHIWGWENEVRGINDE